jgi:hypothetical protein
VEQGGGSEGLPGLQGWGGAALEIRGGFLHGSGGWGRRLW